MRLFLIGLFYGLWMMSPGSPALAKDGWLRGATAKATSTQVEKLFGPENLVSMTGLKEVPAGSGSFQMTTNGYAEGGNCWHSNYLAGGPDERPLVEFDLGQACRISRLHIWNHNGSPHRGFRQVILLTSRDGIAWSTVRQRLTLAIAPGRDDYTGESYPLEAPVIARHLRMLCVSTHRGGGQPDLAGLGKVWFFGEPIGQKAALANSKTKTPSETPFRAVMDVPFDAGWIDVTQPPYLAKGDGKTDDSAALQLAINDWQGTGATVFLPKGTYLITTPLSYQPGKGNGDNNLFGAGRGVTTIRLKDGTCTDPKQPRAVIDLAFNGRPDGSGVHADWFNNNVADLTIDTGANNPGAIGLRYYSNNVGSARRLEILSRDGQGQIGLDLGYADQNGPCLAKEIEITGFATGVLTGATVNSQTLEQIRIRGATAVGFENRGQCLSLRKLDVESSGPGFVSQFGVVALIDSTFRATGAAENLVAVRSRETLFARNLVTKGYAQAIDNQQEGGTADVTGPKVDEFVSQPVISRFAGKGRSLNLPIRETPASPVVPLSQWANVLHYREVTDPDDSAAFVRAAATGAGTLYWPWGVNLTLGEPVKLPTSVVRIVGFFAGLRASGKDRIGFVIAEESDQPLVIEQVSGHVAIQHAGRRPIVARDTMGVEGLITGPADVYLDNVVGEWEFGTGRTWCRQFNTEREGVHAVNHGGALWILGLKTERGGTLVETRAGGKTEIIGGLSYTTTMGQLAPMFTARDAALSVTLGEVCYSGDPFQTLVVQTIDTKGETIRRGDAPLRPEFLQGSAIPLYTGQP